MSNSTLSDLPDNLYFLDAARRDFLSLEGHQRHLVAKALCKIASAPSQFGKPLGRQGDRDLTGFRSTSVDRKDLRIVWTVSGSGRVEIALIVVVGQRSNEEVYAVASRRRAVALDLKRILRDILKS